MRLTESEKSQICRIVQSFCPKTSAKLYLYGSRTDDTKRGGDIDLLLLVSDNAEKVEIESKIHYLLSEIKQAIGDQHIDFTVLTQNEAEIHPFFESILPDAILLTSKWQK